MSVWEGCVRKPPTDNVPSLQDYLQKALEQHWNDFFENNFPDLEYVFAYFHGELSKHILGQLSW